MSDQFGKYHLLAALGSGGMADVLLAHAEGPGYLGLGKLVVLKCIRPNLAEDAVFIAMLVEEARLSARLNHPNVVQTIEVGDVDGRFYIAMEYLEGQVLTRVQRAGRARGLPNAIQYRILVDVLAGLHHAHELTDYDGTPLDIVHRDATPHNVLVTYDGVAKLIDFGVAKADGHGVETMTGIIKGKLNYMAPEQAMAVGIDRRADIFSVGVMLWEVATGKRMWSGMQEAVIFRKLATGEVPSSPRAVDPTVPEALDRICRRALAVQPDDRYSTALEMQQDLEAYLAESGQTVTTRDVARTMSEMFAEERLRMRQHVDAELARRGCSMPASVPPAPSIRFGGSSPPTPIPRPPLATSEPPPAYTKAAKRAPTESSSLPWFAVAVLTLGIASIASSWRIHRAPEVHTAARLPPVAAVKWKTARLVLRATPAEARFSIDGGPLLDNPHVMVVIADGREHRIRVEAPGYAERTRTISFVDDMDLEVALEREVVEAEPSSSATPGRRPTRGPPAKRQLDTNNPWD